MQAANRASFEFSIHWRSEIANHLERQYVAKVDFWRDIFPGAMEQQLSSLAAGESRSETFKAGELTPPFEPRKIKSFKSRLFEGSQCGRTITPSAGRFYPQGYAWKALNCFQGDFTPFRLTKIDGEQFTADTNHPLGSFDLTLKATLIESLDPGEERGGSCNDIAELMTTRGPGMQAPYPGVATDFYSNYPFSRVIADDDANFYSLPRMVPHLDATACRHVETLYGNLLTPGGKVLDLMASWDSHLADSPTDLDVTGLGMNTEELQANGRLSQHQRHDLNRSPKLPFEDDQFDTVVCTASIEYLTQPIEVIKEVARVTKAGGLFVTTFSDRWFPGKEIEPWADMHPFERLGFVLDLYRKSEAFNSLHTESIRGWPRPADDAHIVKSTVSDPVFAVWGRVKP